MIIKEKLEQAVEILKRENVDCWITFVRETQINGDPVLPFLVPAALTWHSAIIITPDDQKYAIVGKYDVEMIKETKAYDDVIGYISDFKAPLIQLLKQINPKKIAVNYSIDSEICDGLTHGMYLILYNILKEMGLENNMISAENIVSSLREQKSQTEIEIMKKAVDIADEILKDTADFIKSGVTEIDIAEFIRNEVKKRGLTVAWEPAVCPSVFTGPDTAEAHFRPTKRKVEKGHLINIDFGVRYKNYTSDIQRMYYVVKDNENNLPEPVQKGFDVIKTAIRKAKDMMKPGVVGYDIDKIAREYIVNNGYGEFPHALGHQVGIFDHDGTALLGPDWEKYAQKPFKPLKENMIFTIEPRLNIPGYGIMSIEEMVIVKKDRAEWFSNPQEDIYIIKN